MRFPFPAAAAAVLIGVCAPAALSQPASAPKPAFSAASSSANPSTYRSAFDGYRGYKDQPVGSWREANDTVHQAGGWQAYAREAAGEEASGALAASAPAGHSGAHTPSASGTPAPMSPAASSPGPSPAPVKAPPASGATKSPANPASAGHVGHQH